MKKTLIFTLIFVFFFEFTSLVFTKFGLLIFNETPKYSFKEINLYDWKEKDENGIDWHKKNYKARNMKKGIFDLSEKVALITGGNGGIGLGMAEGLAECGANIAIWGRNKEKNEESKNLLSKYSIKVNTYEVDVSQEKEVIDNVKSVLNDFGRIDSVFANAGMNVFGGSFEEMNTDAYRKVLSVNLDGVLE